MFDYKYTKQFTYVSWSLVFFAHLYDFCVFSTMVNHLFEVVPIVLKFHNSALYKVVMMLLTTTTMTLVVMMLLTTRTMPLTMMGVGLYTCVQEYLPDLIAIYVLS